MGEERSTMDEITCHTEPITKGFKLHWTIEKFAQLLSVKETLKSPVFKALSWNWTIEMRRETPNYPNNLAFKLYLVDENGNKMATIPEEETLFNTKMMSITSLLSENGELLAPTKNFECKVLKNHLGNNNSYLTGVNFNGSRLLEIINDHRVDRVQVILELSGLAGIKENVSAANNSMNAIEKIILSRMKLFEEGKFTDFLIRTGDGREIRAHRVVLYETRYFEALFDLGGVEAQKGEITVLEPFPVMNSLIRYLYTGKFPEIDGDGNDFAMDMFIAAEKYQIDELKDHLEKIVVSMFSVESVCTDLAKLHLQGIDRMKAKAAEFIRLHRAEVEKTEGWRQFSRDHPEVIAYI